MRIVAGLICVLAGLTALTSIAQTPLPRSPRVNYMTNCQGCHLPAGDGMTAKVPPMRGVVAGFLTVPGGREYLLRVPGVANSTLSDTDLAALMNWLIETMGPAAPKGFEPFSPNEVAILRKQRLQDVNAVRAALVNQMTPELRAKAGHPTSF